MYERMESRPEFLPKDNDEGVLMATSKDLNYAFLMESSSIQYIIERNCELTMVGDVLDDKNYGIGMRKGNIR